MSQVVFHSMMNLRIVKHENKMQVNKTLIFFGQLFMKLLHVTSDDGRISRNVYIECFYCFNFVILT